MRNYANKLAICFQTGNVAPTYYNLYEREVFRGNILKMTLF